MEHGLRELINEADSLGNTPLHVLIVRYALEERRYGYQVQFNKDTNTFNLIHRICVST